ncbi:MAG: diguanylate cyclase, partial [Rhodospirillaceae bacterium]|nr:diguanylate cyclase [Rhodospirillaceae bacterium]
MANPALQATHRLQAQLAPPTGGGASTSLVECLSEGVITADRQGTVLYASGPALAMIGMRAADVLGKSLETVIPEFTLNDALIAASKEIALPRENGFSRSIAVSAHPMAVGGEEIIATVLTDHSERDAARDALAKSNARYALAAAGANDGLWEWDLEEGSVQFSARWRTLLGLEATAIKHTPEEWLCRIHPEDVDSFCGSFDSHLEGETPQFEHEYRMKHANGEFRWVQARGIVARREDGEPFLMAGSQSDITDRKLAEESLNHGALHDALTGLPNRELLLDRVNQALARQGWDEGQNFALAILDLDRFMIVNESLGHAAGDELLVSLARRLEKKVAPGNTLARLGGDEFAVLLEDFHSVEQVQDVIGDLQAEISQPFDMNGQQIFVSASIGVAVGATRYNRAEEVLRDADLAMYRAKKEGKAGFEIFDESRHRGPVDLLKIETNLRH